MWADENDLTQWTAAELQAPSFSYSTSIFEAFTLNGNMILIFNSPSFMFTKDGVTWNTKTISSGKRIRYMYHMCYGSGAYLATLESDNQNVWYSTDLINWKASQALFTVGGIGYANNYNAFIAIGEKACVALL